MIVHCTESFTNPSQRCEGFDVLSGSKRPRLPQSGKSFTNPSQAFVKDFGRCKSRNIKNKHTFSSLNLKSFPRGYTRAVFACVSRCEGFRVKDFPSRVFAASKSSALPSVQAQGIDHESHLRVLSLFLSEVIQPTTERVSSPFANSASCGRRAPR